VIPFMHWGWEYETVASERQRKLARIMIDAGADAVVGGHPHVRQDTEHYLGKPIIYSLGNFVFDGFDAYEKVTGSLLRLEVDKTGVTSWRTFTAHIDSNGTPHRVQNAKDQCWQRGAETSSNCVAP